MLGMINQETVEPLDRRKMSLLEEEGRNSWHDFMNTPSIGTRMYPCPVNPILMSAVTTSIALQCSLIRACSTTKLLFKLRNIIIEELLGFWTCCYCGFSDFKSRYIGLVQASLTFKFYASHRIRTRPMSWLPHFHVHGLDDLMKFPA